MPSAPEQNHENRHELNQPVVCALVIFLFIRVIVVEPIRLVVVKTRHARGFPARVHVQVALVTSRGSCPDPPARVGTEVPLGPLLSRER
jgi:hypothetical protein